MQCKAIKKNGQQCTNKAQDNSCCCGIHSKIMNVEDNSEKGDSIDNITDLKSESDYDIANYPSLNFTGIKKGLFYILFGLNFLVFFSVIFIWFFGDQELLKAFRISLDSTIYTVILGDNTVNSTIGKLVKSSFFIESIGWVTFGCIWFSFRKGESGWTGKKKYIEDINVMYISSIVIVISSLISLFGSAYPIELWVLVDVLFISITMMIFLPIIKELSSKY